MQIKAVTFDVGGTLIEPWPSVGHIYSEVAAQHGAKNVSAEVLNARFRSVWKSRSAFEHSRAAWEELVDEVFLNLVSDAPSRTFFAQLYEQFAEPKAWRIFDDVVPALDALASQGFKLGVISNWDERLRGLLPKLKLDRYFEAFAISCEVGFSKPSPVIFEHAATKLGVPSHLILHVGDSLEADVEGAKRAGFNAWKLHRDTKTPDNKTLSSLAELPAKLAKFFGPE